MEEEEDQKGRVWMMTKKGWGEGGQGPSWIKGTMVNRKGRRGKGREGIVIIAAGCDCTSMRL
jgi:hypothetical protein